MQETEAEVLARIEQTRARMGDTIDRIGDRVNPDRVQAEIKARARDQVREAKANVKYKARSAMRDIEHEVSDAGRGLWHTIRENPIPAGMVGVGLAWLVANGVTDDHHEVLDYRTRPGAGPRRYAGAGDGMPAYDHLEPGYDARDRAHTPGYTGYTAGTHAEDDHGMSERASEATDQVREKASEAADTVRDRASHLAHRASEGVDDLQDRASHLAHRASERADELQDRAGNMARRAGYRARRAERRVEDAVQDNPLAAGALVAALGFAAGMMIPETRKENEMFGPARDRMMDQAGRQVRRAGQKAKEAAKDHAGQAARDAVDEVTGGGSGRERSAMTEPGR